jgi:hypothetical protein
MAKSISDLQIPEKWKKKFLIIEEAGGVNTLDVGELTFGKRFSLFWNIWALLFGPFYYLFLGLWRQALSYFSATFIAIVLLVAGGLIEIADAIGVGVSIFYMMRANVLYYRKVVLGQNRWL